MSETTKRFILLILLAAAVVPYFVGLGDSAIWDANEAFYVETPREMMERGDYVSPTFNYEPRLNKPVLSYWIVAGFYRVFGVSVAVQRLPIALAALALIATAGLLGWLGWPDDARPHVRTNVALWAALGLAVAPRLVMFARRIFIDVYISMFMAMTLLCFAASERYPERRRLFLALMYVTVGLGMLTKGPVAAVVPGLVFAVYLLVHRELPRVRAMMIPGGALIVLAIVLPWYAALYVRDGWTYIVSFFVGENVDRFTSGLGVQVQRGPFFYLPVLFSDSFPWAIFLVPAAIIGWRERRSRGAAAATPDTRVRTLLWLWIAVFVGFFSLSAGKQDLYIFPIVPAVCALGGWAIARATDGVNTRAVAWTAVAIGVVLLIVGVGLMWLYIEAGGVYAIQGVPAVAIIGLLTGAAAVRFGVRGAVVPSAAALAVGFVALNAVFVLRVLPSFEAYKPVPGFADTIARNAAPADAIVTYDQAMPSLVYYLRRHVDEIFDDAEIASVLKRDQRVFAVMSEDDFGKVRQAVDASLCVIDRRPTLDVRLKSILARDPLPQLVVVTNRCGG